MRDWMRRGLLFLLFFFHIVSLFRYKKHWSDTKRWSWKWKKTALISVINMNHLIICTLEGFPSCCVPVGSLCSPCLQPFFKQSFSSRCLEQNTKEKTQTKQKEWEMSWTRAGRASSKEIWMEQREMPAVFMRSIWQYFILEAIDSVSVNKYRRLLRQRKFSLFINSWKSRSKPQ